MEEAHTDALQLLFQDCGQQSVDASVLAHSDKKNAPGAIQQVQVLAENAQAEFARELREHKDFSVPNLDFKDALHTHPSTQLAFDIGLQDCHAP